MKLGSRVLGVPNIEVLVLPRGDGDIVFKAQAVAKMDGFEALCPEPKPPTILARGGTKTQDVNDKDYLEAINKYGEARFHYMAVQSLKATDELEWETVNESDSETWGNYTQELEDAGFTSVEVNRIVQRVMDANCLNEERIDEARKRFLLQAAEEAARSTIPADEQSST